MRARSFTPLTSAAFLITLIVPIWCWAVSDIGHVDFEFFLSKAYATECAGMSRKPVSIASLSFHDFGPSVGKVAMVSAYSCESGTAGPDIHGVYALNGNGEAEELTVNDNKGRYRGKPLYAELIGNRNFEFRAEDDYLIQTFTDGSGRQNPLNIYYRLKGREFQISKIEKGDTYSTSFDCKKARSENEIAICGVPALAQADKELADLYHSILGRLQNDQKNKFQEQQRDWIIQRDKTCLAFKNVADCLHPEYAERIQKLTSLLESIKR